MKGMSRKAAAALLASAAIPAIVHAGPGMMASPPLNGPVNGLFNGLGEAIADQGNQAVREIRAQALDSLRGQQPAHPRAFLPGNACIEPTPEAYATG